MTAVTTVTALSLPVVTAVIVVTAKRHCFSYRRTGKAIPDWPQGGEV